ncbi:MAG: hypothetical protein ACK5LR_02505, partial [Mangrovibacterium sp.]
HNKMQADSIEWGGSDVLRMDEEDKKKEKFEAQEAKSKDDELTSDTEVDELPKDGKRIADEVESGKSKAEEQEEVPEDFKLGKEKLPANILMQGISEDPQEFLSRRFKYQYKKQFPDGVVETHGRASDEL